MQSIVLTKDLQCTLDGACTYEMIDFLLNLSVWEPPHIFV